MSAFNNLRGFRIQKKPMLKPGDGSSASDQTYKRIVSHPDSSDSEADTTKESKNVPTSSVSGTNGSSNHSNEATIDKDNNTQFDTDYKEKQLRFLLDVFPGRDAMVLQDVLLRHNWDGQAAMNEMLQNPQNHNLAKRPGNFQSGNAKKRIKRRREDSEAETDDSDMDDSDFEDHRVFDSDAESDEEISDVMTKDKQAVLDFLQTANPNELRLMSGCSQKKIDVLIDSRPFNGWIDLVSKLSTNKHLNTDLLNSAQNVLATRNNVKRLMHKCQKLAMRMETAVAEGGGLIQQPSILAPGLKLASYQMIGLNWLVVLHKQGVNGILADEMGLGKTIQVIAFLAYLKETGQAKAPHLVVVPASTLDNWKNEFEKWSPTTRVFLYYGNMDDRRYMRVDFSKGILKDYDVVLTTYNLVTNTPEERKMFRVTQMHYVIFDEAHMLKNMNTQRYENLIRIKAYKRLLLTGTPLQNNLVELMSLLIFVMPQMFAGKSEDLKNLFAKGAKSAASQDAEDDIPNFERDQIAKAKRIMKPFVLRRLKCDVLKDLPQKTVEKVLVQMHPGQEKQYKELVEFFRRADGSSVTGKEIPGMSMMTDMRKLANHPVLMRFHYDEPKLTIIAKRLSTDETYKDKNQLDILQDLTFHSDFEIHKLTQAYPSIRSMQLPLEKFIPASGKFAKLDQMLPQLEADGHRVLIFSQYVIMLDVLEAYLKLKKIKFLRLDGSTSVILRQELIDQYNEDESILVFLLSTKAGGLGINLTAADTVIIHDIDFNPYNDKQAEDRCHRMGQKRPVTVHYFISKGTIEEGMFELAKEKLKLEKRLTGEGENEPAEMKSVARLLSLSLGLDTTKAESLLSPQKKSS